MKSGAAAVSANRGRDPLLQKTKHLQEPISSAIMNLLQPEKPGQPASPSKNFFTPSIQEVACGL